MVRQPFIQVSGFKSRATRLYTPLCRFAFTQGNFLLLLLLLLRTPPPHLQAHISASNPISQPWPGGGGRGNGGGGEEGGGENSPV